LLSVSLFFLVSNAHILFLFASSYGSVIPTVSHLKAPGNNGIRALLLAPTRELAEQIHREVLRLVDGRRFKICLLGKKVSSKAIASQVC